MGDKQQQRKDFDLDLDTLKGEPKFVRLNNKTLKVYPPDILQLLEIVDIVQKIDKYRSLDQDSLTSEVQGEMVESISEALKVFKRALCRLIPDLEGIDITSEQMFALFDFLGELVIPSEHRELRDRGIQISPKASKKGGSDFRKN